MNAKKRFMNAEKRFMNAEKRFMNAEKRFMKAKLLCIMAICAGLVILLTACGIANRNDTSTGRDRSIVVPIRWGYGYYGDPFSVVRLSGTGAVSPDVEIVQHINSTFGVAVTPELMDRGYDKNNPPDIFATMAAPYTLYSYGATRTIPIDMIARFAPSYYNLLRSIDYGLDTTRCRETDALLGLPIYTGAQNQLTTFSVYRLDVLQRHGVAIPNDIVPLIEGRIYFSPTQFTFYQFQEFAQFIHVPNRYAPTLVDTYSQLQHLSILKGMFGLGSYIVNDNGIPNFYFADPRYKDFLTFMADLYDKNAFTLTPWRRHHNPDWGQHIYHNNYFVLRFSRFGLNSPRFVQARPPVVWFQSAKELSFLNSILSNVSDMPGGKFLITPPEVGPLGHSGAGINSTSVFAQCYTWVIGSQVSDDELAAILEVFDYVTFDISAYVMTNFGIEGQHFEWEGEPFASRIIQNDRQLQEAYTAYGARVFDTGMRLPDMDVFRHTDNALTQFAASEAGRRLIIPPYREDFHGDFAQRYAELTERYGETLMRIRSEFLFSAIRGEIDTETEWYAYIDELHANGLSQFLALIRAYPASN